MVDVLESQRLPTHELDPVFFYTILNIGGNLTIVLELCTQFLSRTSRVRSPSPD